LQLGVQVGIYIQVRIHAQRSMERRQRQIKWVSKESYDLWLLSSARFMHHLCGTLCWPVPVTFGVAPVPMMPFRPCCLS
jgi:hypothetical protein